MRLVRSPGPREWPGRAARAPRLFRVAWVFIALAALGTYAYRSQQQLVGYVVDLNPWSVLAAALAIVSGRLAVAWMMSESLRAVGRPLPPVEAFTLYAVTDAAKYLPGGVWGIVSRMASYAERRVGAKEMWRAFAVENAWLVLSAFSLGAIVLLPQLSEIVGFPKSWPLGRSTLVLGVVMMAGAWIGVLQLASRFVLASFLELPELCRIVCGQVVICGCLGLSLGLLWPRQAGLTLLVESIGVFAIARGVGYVAFFAPAGIGVREAIIVALMAHELPVGSLVALTVAHRLVTILTEAVMLLVVTQGFVSPAAIGSCRSPTASDMQAKETHVPR